MDEENEKARGEAERRLLDELDAAIAASAEAAKQKLVEDTRFTLDTRTDVFVQHARQVKVEGGGYMRVLCLRDFTLALADYIEALVERGLLERTYG